MSGVGVQLLLPRQPAPLDDAYIVSRKGILHAFISSADQGGLDDKQAAAAAGMDPATWSRFKQGDVGIKPANLMTFRSQCGNDIALARWAWECGYELKHRETELERQLRAEREHSEKVEAENKLLRNLLQGRAV